MQGQPFAGLAVEETTEPRVRLDQDGVARAGRYPLAKDGDELGCT
ncbi:hypothetical protein X728_28910 [Mesorhizobium sp. L103C120A0]|nr:hypothetical protein X728_28910 [Mesorhizobium sp. L103C120A0]